MQVYTTRRIESAFFSSRPPAFLELRGKDWLWPRWEGPRLLSPVMFSQNDTRGVGVLCVLGINFLVLEIFL